MERRPALLLGAAMILGAAGVSACGGTSAAPTVAPTAPTTAPAVAPTNVATSVAPAATTAPSAAPSAAASAAPGAAADLTAGKAVFDQNCNTCHPGGDRGVGPALKGRNLSADRITRQVRNGGGSMPAFSASQISDQQLNDLVVYVQSLK